MRLASIRLQNFKSFADTKVVRAGRLTVVFGRNNVGKSSLLQALLLLRQTLDSPELGPRLTLRGPLLDGGGFADVVHLHESKRRLSIELGLADENGCAVTVGASYVSDEPRAPRLVSLRIARDSKVLLEIRRGQGQGGPYELRVEGKSVGGEVQGNFSFPARSLFPLIGDEPRRKGRPNQKRQVVREAARTILESCQSVIQSMRAVGPYRHPPARRYEYSGSARTDIDVSGQNVVDALIDDVNRRGRGKGALLRSVNRWLKVVGDVRIMPIRTIARAAKLFELRVRDIKSQRWANLRDIGSGIGQALPVIVEGLRTEPGGLFIVEEPETHLHPDAQLAMADFLIDLVRSGRSVVIETHSEHMLLRLRRSLLEDTSLSRDDVSLLVVEKTAQGASTVHAIDLDSLGQPMGWPKGFFEAATRERLALLKAMAARATTLGRQR